MLPWFIVRVLLPEQIELGHLEGDQASLQPYERGVFEVDDRGLHEEPNL